MSKKWKDKKEAVDRQKDLDYLSWLRIASLKELVDRGQGLLKTKSFPAWKKVALQRAVKRELEKETTVEVTEDEVFDCEDAMS